MSGRYSKEVAQNLMVAPEKTYRFIIGGSDYDVPDDFMVTMIEVEADGNVKFLAYGDTGDANARTLYRYKGTQYAGRIIKLYSTSAVNIILWGASINKDNVDDVSIVP